MPYNDEWQILFPMSKILHCRFARQHAAIERATLVTSSNFRYNYVGIMPESTAT